MTYKYYTLPITSFILILNVCAAYIIFSDQNNLIGDLVGISTTQHSVIYSLFLIAISLIGMALLFDMLEKIKPLLSIKDSDIFPLILITLELSFIIYVQFTGFFVAGNNARAGTLISAFFVLINIDVLVLIFITHCKDSKYKGLITALWVLSFIQRGWVSYLFLLILITYVGRRVKNKNNWKIGIVTVLFVLILPYVQNLKNDIRNTGGNELPVSYSESIGQQLKKVIDRVQTVSHVAFILDNEVNLQKLKNSRVSTDFYQENISSVFLNKINLKNDALNTSDLLAKYIATDYDTSWNVNPSLVGWIIIQNDYYLLPVLWVIFLCLVFTMLSKAISNDEYTQNMRWLFWLVFLFPGWIFQFSSVILSLFIYILIHIAIGKFKRFIS